MLINPALTWASDEMAIAEEGCLSVPTIYDDVERHAQVTVRALGRDDEFAADLRWLRAAGMHVVFAAGNGGPHENSSVSPANNAGAMAVGALDGSGQMAMFTSRGVSACDARPYPDVMAPGELLRTTDLSAGGVPVTTSGTGTSFAAAVVSGELALLAQARPSMPMGEREALLRAVPGETAKSPLLRALGLSTARERQP